MTKLSRCTSVLLLIDDEEKLQDVFGVASENDVSVYIPDDTANTEVSLYKNIISTTSMLKYCKEYRERVVVVSPSRSELIKLIPAGYTRFLFDTRNALEVLVSLFAPIGDMDQVPSTKIGRIVADFMKHKFTIDGKEIYLSKGEKKFLLDKYILKKAEPHGASWRIHKCRIRKRFGKDVI